MPSRRGTSRFGSPRTWLKFAGLAGAVGVAATGVVVARSERRRREYEPDEIRERLHQRLAVATAAAADDPVTPRRGRTRP
ncbi:hypothetical protein [Rhodococcoides corynebacterioides]|uniref:Secreted protein n=1 Tax=Rhodococcoides corynebacterioides TaxID=53972 RepID=A0ABS7P1R9_9NOCA|nr:hypothetical protein [Rhodococcus corynebacterioides]MBY6366360.1 hypothetical protein [Rhodococcus corynebacterioides]MBY6406729.1 hypothetical protein [Rhodococcus corynebacterioides]